MKLRGRLRRFTRDILAHTPFMALVLLLAMLWLGFSLSVYLAEDGAPGTSITSLGRALYWGVAAFSTAGIADAPVTGRAQLIGGIWIVVGSVLFFGTVVATITGYFLRPVQRPVNQIIETVELNLERLEDLSVEELDLLKATVDSLILHMEGLKNQRSSPSGNTQ